MDKITEITKINQELSTLELAKQEVTQLYEEIQPKKSKVAIVGFASNWQDAPWEDKDCEIWGLNELYMNLQQIPDKARADRWFEIHNRTSPTKNRPEHIKWLQQCPVPLYMWQHYEDMPNSIPYPLEQVIDFTYSKGLRLSLPDNTEKKNRYITNSISYMFLLAWMEGFKEIHIYGVDLAQNEEYYYQRPNLEYFIGAAQATGVKVVMPITCDLCKAYSLYGFESDGPLAQKMKKRKQDIIINMEKYNAEHQKAIQAAKMYEDKVKQMKASVGEIEFWIKNQRV